MSPVSRRRKGARPPFVACSCRRLVDPACDVWARREDAAAVGWRRRDDGDLFCPACLAADCPGPRRRR